MDVEPGQQRRRILIVGLGNVLMMDDGVGVHAVRELQKDPPHDVCIAEVGTAVLRAIHLIEQADKIIAIDAVKIGGPPGTIYAFSAESAENQGHQVSLHELNLLGALRFLPPGHPRPEIVILGVEPQVIDYGLYLSEAVQAVLPQVVQAAREIVAGLERNPDTWSVAELEEAAIWR
jgi:hydrogenase maturation protease